ncbi:hypothetical protein [Streptomyces sp. NPDC005438]|uniref:hypothetical protein n=1 Tax=Streptomyces sp. NPDC005438 TaxID=3156880 RepID=UPI0033AC9212
MPRPTAAQLAYGSGTVVLATLAMLLLSGARSGAGIVVICCLALALGLFAALRLPRRSGVAPLPSVPVARERRRAPVTQAPARR